MTEVQFPDSDIMTGACKSFQDGQNWRKKRSGKKGTLSVSSRLSPWRWLTQEVTRRSLVWAQQVLISPSPQTYERPKLQGGWVKKQVSVVQTIPTSHLCTTCQPLVTQDIRFLCHLHYRTTILSTLKMTSRPLMLRLQNEISILIIYLYVHKDFGKQYGD